MKGFIKLKRHFKDNKDINVFKINDKNKIVITNLIKNSIVKLPKTLESIYPEYFLHITKGVKVFPYEGMNFVLYTKKGFIEVKKNKYFTTKKYCLVKISYTKLDNDLNNRCNLNFIEGDLQIKTKCQFYKPKVTY